jgi:hypothetical protein
VAASSVGAGAGATPAGGMSIQVRALHAYTPRSPDELQLKQGDLITVVAKEDDGWWHGVKADGSTGVFPSNFVKEV